MHVHRHQTNAQFADKGMRAPVTALGGIGERQDKPLIAARDGLQAQGARRGQFQRLAGQVGGRGIAGNLCLDQPVTVQKAGDMGHVSGQGRALRGNGHRALGQQLEIKQAVGVVKGGPQNLPPRRVFEGGRDAPHAGHAPGIHRIARAKARQCRAVSADQKHRLDQITARLLDGKGGKIGVVK